MIDATKITHSHTLIASLEEYSHIDFGFYLFYFINQIYISMPHFFNVYIMTNKNQMMNKTFVLLVFCACKMGK